MIYEVQCEVCGTHGDMRGTLADHKKLVSGKLECDCGGRLKQIFTTGPTSFMRSPFVKGYQEHVSPEGVNLRSERHLKDVCDENGLTSMWLENRK